MPTSLVFALRPILTWTRREANHPKRVSRGESGRYALAAGASYGRFAGYFSGVRLTRVMLVTGMAAAVAGGYVHVGFSAAPAGAPRGVVEDCSTASFADFPGAFTNPRNLAVGPLVMIGARGTADWASVFHGNKFPLLVRNGHRVTLELSARTRRFAGLAYGPLPQGETHLRDTHRVVRFVACAANRDSGSTADAQPVTFWSGGS